MKTHTIAINYGKMKINPKQIKYIESVFGNYSKIHLTHGDTILTAFTLKHYYSQLNENPRFQLARKGLLVNLDLCKGFKEMEQSKFIELKTGETFKLSRRRGRALLALVS